MSRFHRPAPLLLVLFLLLAGCARETLVREPEARDALHPVGDRITDEAIADDLSVIRNLRARLAQLNDTGRWPLDNYHVCKAQAWIDFAFTEYTDNDRGTVVESALGQARELIGGMEADASDLPLDTPILKESRVVRQDLWDFVADTKAKGLECGDCALARLEVQLVAAGHDHKELGWRHAASGILAAERYSREVAVAVAGCEMPEGAGVCEALPPDPDLEALRLPTVVHFAYDRDRLIHTSAAVLERVALTLNRYPEIRVTLIGHTDVRGGDAYNVDLGLRRAQSVQAYLMAAGIDAARLVVRTQGRTQPLQGDVDRLRAHAMDRRVELVFEDLPDVGVPVETERHLIDLQPDF